MNSKKNESFSPLRSFIRNIRGHLEGLHLRTISSEKRFEKIYHNNKWGSTESLSGPGSELSQTKTIRSILPILLKEIGAKSILDIPCGDFNWMKEINLDIDSYIGADIVKNIVDSNNHRFDRKDRKFVKLDITKDELPKVDIILCRDCLVHFSFKDIYTAIENIKKSRSEYLLTTTHIDSEKNIDILTGYWRPLNLQKPPFNWPVPIMTINENSRENMDKRLCLWKISDINL